MVETKGKKRYGSKTGLWYSGDTSIHTLFTLHLTFHTAARDCSASLGPPCRGGHLYVQRGVFIIM